jgi:group I intron endonuclease
MSYYIYCITNKINNKTYIGQRKCPKNKLPKEDDYMGSGELVIKAIKKYGLSNFSKTILESEIEMKKEVDKREIYWIAEYKKIGKAEYNISVGGTGGNLGEEVVKRIGIKQKICWSNSEYKERQRKSHLGKSPSNKGVHATLEQIEKNRLKHIGKKQSEETIRKRIEKTKGKKRSADFKRRLFEKLKGHIVSDDTRKKMSEARMGKISNTKGLCWFTNGIKNVMAKECPEGFRKGMTRGLK